MNEESCELLIDYFNDQLDEVTRKQFEEHLKSCKDCQEELQELHELTMDLPFAVPPTEPPIQMKERILLKVFEQREETKVPNEMKPRKRNGLLSILAAVLFLSLLGNAYLLIQNGKILRGTEKSAQSVDQLSKSINLLASKSANASTAATAMLLRKNQQIQLVIQAKNLPKIQKPEAFQVWLLEKGKPYRAGTFVPNSNGEGAVTFTINYSEKHHWDTIAITLEPNSSSKSPKGNIIVSNNF